MPNLQKASEIKKQHQNEQDEEKAAEQRRQAQEEIAKQRARKARKGSGRLRSGNESQPRCHSRGFSFRFRLAEWLVALGTNSSTFPRGDVEQPWPLNAIKT